MPPFRSRRSLALLAYLALSPGAHPRSRLAGLLWSDSSEKTALENLRYALWDLRRGLRAPVVEADRASIAWQPGDAATCDVDEFQRALRDGWLERAIDLYRGDLLAGCELDQDTLFDDWLQAQRACLRESAAKAMCQLTDCYLTHARTTEAIALLQRLLALDPWRESSHAQLMLALALAGERSAALAQYQICRRMLAKELGTEPLPETRALYDRIRAGDIAPLPAHRATGLELRFAGRGQEHACLLQQWEQSRRGVGNLTLVEGEAGLGKTRLVEEALRHVAGWGARILRGRCYEFGGEVAYQAMADALRTVLDFRLQISDRRPKSEILNLKSEIPPVWLAELALLLPELREQYPDLPPPLQVSEAAARQRLFEAVARLLQSLARDQPSLVFFLDDLHWSDQATLDLLQYLIHRLRQERVWFVGAYRPEETPLTHPLTRLRQGLGREALTHCIRLLPLTGAAVAQIAAALSDDAVLTSFLQHESGGNPFILSEVLKGLQETGRLQRGEADRWKVVGDLAHDTLETPGRVEDLTLQRVGRLPEASRWLLNFAVVLGQPFTPDLLGDIADSPMLSPATLPEILADWQNRRLVQPVAAERYDLAHDKIRAAIYHHLDAGPRALLHEHIGLRLFQRAGGQIANLPYHAAVQVAYHFERSLNPRAAAPYLARAADAAQQVHANIEAIDCCRRLLPLAPAAEQVDVLLKLGDLQQVVKPQAEEIETTYRQALALAQASNDLKAQARAWSKLAELQIDLGDYSAALEGAGKAEEAARAANAREELVEALSHKGKAYYRLGKTLTALEIGEEMLTLSTELGARGNREMGLSRRLLCAAFVQLGRFAEAKEQVIHSLRLHQETNDRGEECNDLNWLGEIARLRGDYRAAVEHYQASLNIARELHFWEVSRRSNLGGVRVGLKEYAAAEAELRELIALPEAANSPVLSETYRFLAQALLGQGKVEEALSAAQRALAIAQELNQKDVLCGAWRVLGEVMGDWKGEVGKWKLEVGSWMPEGEVKRGDEESPTSNIQHPTSNTQDCFAESLRLCDEAGMEAERAWTLFAWARYELERGDRPRGEAMRREAEEIAVRLGLALP